MKSIVIAVGCVAGLFAGAAPAAVQHTVGITSDGRDELQFTGGSLTVQHVSYNQPSGLTVDGAGRSLTFVNNTAVVGPTGINGNFWVRKTAGRDGGYAVQRSDGFSLAVIDDPNGSGAYGFDLADTPGSNTTDWMYVQGAGATPGRMSFVGQSGYAAQAAGKTTTFSFTLDGTDELAFVGGSLVVRHLSFNQIPSVTINGVTIPLTYSNNQSQSVALTLPDQFQFTQTAGRSTLYATQTPVGLLVGAADEAIGSDTYTFTITSVPEPATLGGLACVALSLRRRTRR